MQLGDVIVDQNFHIRYMLAPPDSEHYYLLGSEASVVSTGSD